MRFTFLILLAWSFPTGCIGASSELASKPSAGDDDADTGSGSGSNAPGSAQCNVDEDCAATGARCCDCPTFATRVDDPSVSACSEVECPGGGESCSATRAVCKSGLCALACEPATCSTSCAEGYARDASGCLTCECAVPMAVCTDDNQCVRVEGDCCGCSRGGRDTAVLAGTEGAYGDSLGCGTDAQCPDVDTCVAGDAPHCIQGSCALAQPLPAGACGRPDLPACAACIVNADEQADTHGVGVCQPI